MWSARQDLAFLAPLVPATGAAAGVSPGAAQRQQASPLAATVLGDGASSHGFWSSTAQIAAIATAVGLAVANSRRWGSTSGPRKAGGRCVVRLAEADASAEGDMEEEADFANAFPFSAVVGQEEVKLALLLNLV
ncbi:unnamed protein product, partial [Polarella glacialis]|uniref:Uncharacterized protein n=1 Tax=Polarella glacialis TaxID=89957 RepID=A0A813F745_POLGL